MSHGNDIDLDAGGTLHVCRGPRHIAELAQSINKQNTEAGYKGEGVKNEAPAVEAPTVGTLNGDEEETIVGWDDNDEENPYNWSKAKKCSILAITMILIVNSTMGSSLPSMAIPYITQEWGITSQDQMVLPISTYLIGYVFGPIIWGPLSEHFGRRNLTLVTFAFFLIWTLSCAVAPDWPTLLVFRFLTGAFASSPIAIVAGFLADVFNNPVTRGRAFAWFMATTVFGPLFAPIISGFCSTSIGWRWTFWVALIYGGVCFVALIWLPETFAPVLLTRRAVKLRKQNPGSKVYAAAEFERRDLEQVVTVVLSRPIHMLFKELIVSSTCMYLALCYSIFYMSFQAFPLIFQRLYGLTPGVTGLCFLPIGGGCIISLPLFYLYDALLRDAKAKNRQWAQQEEYRRLPLACVGGPMFAISLFWLGWSARSNVSFVVPMMAGIPFGCGFMLIFMALLNYLTDAYETYAASANAIASCTRSLVAVVLPLATTPMFERLGIAGACSLLGGLSLLMVPIPFLFIWRGVEIRQHSKFCIKLKEEKAEAARKVEEERQRRVQREASRRVLQNGGADASTSESDRERVLEDAV